MKALKLVTVFGFAALVSACADTNIATRNASIDPIRPAPVAPLAIAETTSSAVPATVAAPVQTAPAHDMRIVAIDIDVPRSLKVSEANLYYPKGDIVWREDPFGDRHAQVKAIFEAAMAKGIEGTDGTRDAILDIEVERFHALTEKSRFSVGGVHSITFVWYLKDPKTGKAMSKGYRVQADLEGFGGQQAIDAVMRGETQKVRITRHLAKVIGEELTRPEGHRNAQLGFLQQLNRF